MQFSSDLVKMAKTRNIFWFIFSVASSLICGCSDGEVANKSFEPTGLTGLTTDYRKLPLDAILVRVDKRSLTKRDLEAAVDNRIVILKAVNPTLKDIKREVFARRYYRIFHSQFLSKALYLNAAENAGIRPSQTDKEIIQKETVMALGSELIRSFSWFKKHLNAEDFRKLEIDCEENTYILAYWRSLAPDAFVVTNDELAAIRKKTSDMNKKSAEARLQQLEKAKKIIARLNAGEDFAKIAAKESITAEEDEAGGVWGKFEHKEIPYDELKALIASMKPGEISAPLELDDGIHIIKLISKEGTDAVSVFNPNETTYTLARIVLSLPVTYAMGSIDEIRRDMRMKKLAPLQKKWLTDLKANASISYPSGTNLWSFLSKPDRNQK